MADTEPAGTGAGSVRPCRRWRKRFFETLAATSNVERAAAAASVTVSRAQEARRNDTDFVRAWQAAIADGYLHLAIEVIRRLREGDLMTANGDKCDFANAIRLIAAHRDGAAKGQQNPVRDVSIAEVSASIDRKIEDIRRRVARQKATSGGDA